MKVSNSYIDITVNVPASTKVWHFAVILADVWLGENVSIGSHTEIGRGSVIHQGSRIGKGVFLPSASRVGENVFIGPGTVFCDDKYPRVNNHNYIARPPRIDDGASIGAGCVILPGVHIGAGAMVGAGSVVVEDVPAGATVYGDAARLVHSFSTSQDDSLETSPSEA